LLAAALAALPAHAQDEVTVTSPRADSVAVTIYRDDLALVTETRTVDLPAGAVTLVVEDVVETLLPQSAIITDVARPLAESNFAFDRLTPRTLLERSIGETVTVTRTNPATGRVTQILATIIAVGEGVVLQIAGGTEALYCSGLPERLELTRVPDELLAKPRLSVKLAAGEAGPRIVRVSYLAHGFSWSSDYVAHLNEHSSAMSLSGWATLTNSTGAVFEQAEVQLVAGKLNILAFDEGGSAAEPVFATDGENDVDARRRIVEQEALLEAALLRECFTDRPELGAVRRDVPARLAMEEVVVTAARVRDTMAFAAVAEAQREELGDYQLYRLPWRTDLNARQTKQVLFLDEPEIRIERLYGLRLQSLTDSVAEDVAIPNLIVRFENTEARGLGEPLPSGVVRAFESYGGREVFAGEAEIADRPVGLPVELVLGRALNVMLEITTQPSRNGQRIVAATEHRVVNNKSVPIDLEIRHAVEGYYTDVELERSSRPMRRRYGDLAWRFSVPPGEEQLTYRLSARVP
jgi:hypothetical protein